MTNPLEGLERTVGKEMFHKIQTSNILCVGAGGIGCELLKDMALSGFRRIQVVDLDTIDVSNLNRQLLFRSQHVGMPKCTVACEVATSMVPPLSIPSDNDDGNKETPTTDAATMDSSSDDLPAISYQAHHGNVCDTSKFNVPFVKAFDLVVNALDNVEARRRVNRLCLAADVPLIEAGTTGYLGQVTVIHKTSGVACYECTTQETQKVYPICTIRSTPSMPVHTIVWSKELYKLLFHSKADESMLFEDPEGEEPSTYMAAVSKLRGLLQSDSNTSDDDIALTQLVRDVLNDLYSTEIQKQLDMGRYKAAKKTPTCLEASILNAGMASSKTPPSSTTEIWSPQESVAALAACLRQAEGTANEELLEEFDKDDDLAMRFVTAASNLRSSVFGIEPLQSLYSAKGIAGNIIPAIATTNAICAGLQILQAFAILKQQLGKKKQGSEPGCGLDLSGSCYYVNCIRNRTRNGLYLTASPLEKPNPKCFVCRNAIIPMALNVDEWTLRDFLAKIVKGRLGFEEPTLMLQGDFIWEEGDGAEDEFQMNLPKKLSGLPCGGIQHGTVLEIDDNSQNLSIQVAITNQEIWEGDEVPDFPFTIGALPPRKKEEKPEEPVAASAAMTSTDNKDTAMGGDDDDDDVVLIVDDGDGETDGDDSKAAGKRSIEEADSGETEKPAKKAKTELSNGTAAAADDFEVIEIED